MSIAVAPLTHRPTLNRSYCPRCQQETLHKAWTCLHCHTDHRPKIVKRKAFGARLVITRVRLKVEL